MLFEVKDSAYATLIILEDNF